MGYKKNYIKIYVTQTLSVVLGFLSLFIVAPFLTSNKEIFGVYSVCISMTTFLSYADLGFLSAGNKYASEFFVNNDIKNEIKYTAATFFILFISMILFAIVFCYFSIYPEHLIKGLDDGSKVEVAKKLFLILAISAPLTVLVRLPQSILSIRVSQHIYQKYQIIGNIIKILSVLYFFNGKYDIVGYYLFVQIVSILIGLLACIKIHNIYNYDFVLFFKSFKIKKKIVKHTYALAFSSLFATVCWVLYYELDNITIGKLLGAEQVACYAIGFTLLNFIRTFLGVLFSPFSNRFFHLVGNSQYDILKDFYRFIVVNTTFIIVPFIIVLTIDMPQFISSWVGPSYDNVIFSARCLVLCNILAFVSYPGGLLLFALEKIKLTYILNGINLIVFWLLVYLTYKSFGYEAFSTTKLITFIISGAFYGWLSIKYLEMKFMDVFSSAVKFLLICTLATLIGYIFIPFMRYSFDKTSLLINLGIMIAQCLVFYITIFCSYRNLRTQVMNILRG